MLNADESTCIIDNEVGLTPAKQVSPRNFHQEMKANRAKLENHLNQEIEPSNLDDVCVPVRLIQTEIK